MGEGHLGLTRLEAIYLTGLGGSVQAVYDLHAFFQTTYHLRDWLANDPSVHLNDAVIEAAMRASKELSICRDFAMRIKHQTLTQKA
jgi:hypothetical protein